MSKSSARYFTRISATIHWDTVANIDYQNLKSLFKTVLLTVSSHGPHSDENIWRFYRDILYICFEITRSLETQSKLALEIVWNRKIGKRSWFKSYFVDVDPEMHALLHFRSCWSQLCYRLSVDVLNYNGKTTVPSRSSGSVNQHISSVPAS